MDPKVVLLYPPNQSLPGVMCKPNGSLAYPYLAGALLEHGIEVSIFDACVGSEKDELSVMFYHSTELPSGLFRTGVSDERILEEVTDADVVGITSIFTNQETMVLATAKLIKQAFPEKLIVAGGVNARSRSKWFLLNGVDVVCLSEAEKTILHIVEAVTGIRDWRDVSAIAKVHNGIVVETRACADDFFWNLDELPLPRWGLLPLKRYWTIARPHGGHFKPGEELRYASLMTTRGCLFTCSYCHIAGETEESVSGAIGRFRLKSDERVLCELEVLKALGVRQVYIEDDMFLGRKQRALRLLGRIQKAGMVISDVNGVNVVHMFRKDASHSYEPDTELLCALRDAGFREIVLAFESATPRVLRKYATNKWDPERMPIDWLIRTCKTYGLQVGGNYMLGYPDETREEMKKTIDLARCHKLAGIDWVNFFSVMPLPGTPLFDEAIRTGNFPQNFNPDYMDWTKANFVNTIVPAEEVAEMRQKAWEEINGREFQENKIAMAVSG